MTIQSDAEQADAEQADAEANTRRGGKSATAFRTISEVADTLDVPAHVLRFWETKFTQIRPLKRGGGRRYYRPEDVSLLRHIRGLLYNDGYTIKGAQRLLRDGSATKAKANEAATGSTSTGGESAASTSAPTPASAPETGSPAKAGGEVAAPVQSGTAAPTAKLDLRTIATLSGILDELQGIKTSLDELGDRIKRGPDLAPETEPDPEPDE